MILRINHRRCNLSVMTAILSIIWSALQLVIGIVLVAAVLGAPILSWYQRGEPQRQWERERRAGRKG